MQNNFLDVLTEAKKENKKLLSILIDPDKIDNLEKVCILAEKKKISALFVGGSLLTGGDMEITIEEIKLHYKGPVIIFPGDFSQASPKADALLFLSLISGRNPDLLIGKHVLFAQKLKKSGLEIIPCGYMLINSGTPTSVEYITNTMPIPDNKPEIAVSTALAGEMLGLKCIYLEGGSGAKKEVNDDIIKNVSSAIQLPLITGGGIKTFGQVKAAWDAGATMVVVGTAIEQDPDWINSIL